MIFWPDGGRGIASSPGSLYPTPAARTKTRRGRGVCCRTGSDFRVDGDSPSEQFPASPWNSCIRMIPFETSTILWSLRISLLLCDAVTGCAQGTEKREETRSASIYGKPDLRAYALSRPRIGCLPEISRDGVLVRSRRHRFSFSSTGGGFQRGG